LGPERPCAGLLSARPEAFLELPRCNECQHRAFAGARECGSEKRARADGGRKQAREDLCGHPERVGHQSGRLGVQGNQ
ncbi:unnamed protein product, partial [Symbiodinium pilosum]